MIKGMSTFGSTRLNLTKACLGHISPRDILVTNPLQNAAPTHLSADLLFNALLGLGQSGHGGHVGPAQGTDDRLQNHISKKLTNVSEEDVQHTVSDLMQTLHHDGV